MTIGPASQCGLCAHFESPIGTDRTRPYCAAFPDSIPDVLLNNEANHREPYPGDHGVRWKSDGEPFPEYAFQDAETPAAGRGDEGDHEERLVTSTQGAKGAEQLHHYWTKGEGLAKWAESPTPWTSLYHHLLKYMPAGKAKRTASEWFHDVFGFWPGSDLNRVTHGKPPRGKVVGPG